MGSLPHTSLTEHGMDWELFYPLAGIIVALFVVHRVVYLFKSMNASVRIHQQKNQAAQNGRRARQHFRR